VVCDDIQDILKSADCCHLGGFSVSYFQNAWVKRAGVGVVFGCQAAIVTFFIIILIPAAIFIGKKTPRLEVIEETEANQRV